VTFNCTATGLQASYSSWVQGLDRELYLCLALGLVLSAVFAGSVLREYRRALARLMKFHQVMPAPAAWWQVRAKLFDRPGVAALSTGSVETLADAMKMRKARIRLATLAAYIAFLFVCFLLASRDSAQTVSLTKQILWLAIAAAGPAIVNVAPQASQSVLIGLMSLAMFLVAMVPSNSPPEVFVYTVFSWPFLALCLHRKLRALFVPLIVMWSFGFLSFLLAALAQLPFSCIPLDPDRAGAGYGLAIYVISFVVCLRIVYRIVCLRGGIFSHRGTAYRAVAKLDCFRVRDTRRLRDSAALSAATRTRAQATGPKSIFARLQIRATARYYPEQLAVRWSRNASRRARSCRTHNRPL
jgi:hypothetical protein